jgi:transposase
MIGQRRRRHADPGRNALGSDPFSGAVYVFRAKRVDRVKLLWSDGSGTMPSIEAAGRHRVFSMPLAI